MLDSVALGIFNILFNLIKGFIAIIFSPLQVLLPNVFSGIIISDFTSNFYGIINQYVIPTATFFANMVPPMTWSLMLIYFNLMISIYGVVFIVHHLTKPLRIIKKIIPFT